MTKTVKPLWALMLILLLSSCRNTGITGKWLGKSAMGMQVKDSSQYYLILREDATALEVNRGIESDRTWQIKEGNLCLKASRNDGGIETCGAYKISGDILIWNISGVKIVYEKQ